MRPVVFELKNIEVSRLAYFISVLKNLFSRVDINDCNYVTLITRVAWEVDIIAFSKNEMINNNIKNVYSLRCVYPNVGKAV